MKHFCTYCDAGYAARLLCLHDSIRRQGEPFLLHVLCFDREMEAIVAAAGQETLKAIPLSELLRADPEYAAVRARRTRVEFYFTSTPVLIRHCLSRAGDVEGVTYLDADLFFFGAPSEVFVEQGEAAVGIVPHRFPPRLAERRMYGTYNVGWVSFRRSPEALACLDWWRERCLEWCHDRVEDGRFADQRYLDDFPIRFEEVRTLDHPGINAAPWNVDGAKVVRRNGRPRIDDRPLIFYHFQGVREVARSWFEPGLRAYGTVLTPELRDLVYLPYIRELVRAERELRATLEGLPGLPFRRTDSGGSLRHRWERAKARWLLPFYGRWIGRLLHCPEDPGGG